MDKVWHQLQGSGRKEQLTADQVKARNVSRPDGKKWVPCEPPAENEILLAPRTASRIEIVENEPAPSAPAAKAENSNAGITAAPVAAKDLEMSKKNKAKAGKPKSKPVKVASAKAPKKVAPKITRKSGKGSRPRKTWRGFSMAKILRYNGAAGVSVVKSTNIVRAMGLLPKNSMLFYNPWNDGRLGRKEVPEFTAEDKREWKKIADKIKDDHDIRPFRGTATASDKPIKGDKKKAKPVAKAKGKAPKKASKPKAKPAATEPMDPDAAIMEAQKAADALVATAAE